MQKVVSHGEQLDSAALVASDEGGPLRIMLEETEDVEGDQERLRALVNALKSYSGEGEVRLSIRQRNGEVVELELPRARRCSELSQRLGEIVGSWGGIGA